MSHLETATLGIEGGQAINVPTSGVEGSNDPKKILKILLERGWTPLPFPTEKAAVEAAGKASKAWEGESHSMNPLESLLQSISSFLPASREAQADPSGFAQQLQQPPQVSGDLLNALAGTMPLVGGMAKVFKPAATEAMSYTDRLLSALKSYTNPMELTKAKGRLQPALQIAEGEPNLATNLLVGQG